MPRPGQGEALGAWALLGTTTLVVLVTYSRLDAAALYNVSHEGLAGGLSRAVVLVNFPVALVADRSRPRRRRRPAAQRVARRGTGDRALGARLGRGRPERPGRPLDQRPPRTRCGAGALADRGRRSCRRSVVRAASRGRPPSSRRRGRRPRPVASVDRRGSRLPSAGRRLPRRRGVHEGNGRTFAAVHLGHHHGGDGACSFSPRCSCPAFGCRRAACGLHGHGLSRSACSPTASVNLAQDLWHEQVVKRGWTDADIPSALVPGARPIWLVIVLLAVLATMLLLRDDEVAAPVRARA